MAVFGSREPIVGGIPVAIGLEKSFVEQDRIDFDLSILYRGPLASCNYTCDYCPFAKQRDSAAELRVDREALERFVAWCAASDRWLPGLSVLFTPWGEALTRAWYRQALTELSHLEHLRKVAIQTNLSCKLDWLADCDRSRVGLWCTYHPTQVELDRFVEQCHRLDELNVTYSVGVVGLHENAGAAEQLRERLRPDVYLWINAYKDVSDYYDHQQVERWTSIDPLFPINNVRHASMGKPCRTGHSVISVDGLGTVRRCHFIKTELGNLYSDRLVDMLAPRLCTNATCGCHIGYVHMDELKLYEKFGERVLERSWGR